MVGHYHRDVCVLIVVESTAHLAEGGRALQQILTGDPSNSQDDLRFKPLDLALEKRRAARHLLRPWIAVIGRTAFEDVGNKDLFSFEAERPQHGIQQLSCAPHKGLALPILISTWCFTDDEPGGLEIANAKHGLSTGLMKLTADTGGDRLPQLIPAHLPPIWLQWQGGIIAQQGGNGRG